MSINGLKAALEQFNNEVVKSLEEKKSGEFEVRLKEIEPQIANIFANALTVALAQVENLVQDEFKSSNQALEFTDAILSKLRRKYRSELSKAMRRFDSVGGHRTALLYRKKIQDL